MADGKGNMTSIIAGFFYDKREKYREQQPLNPEGVLT
jgi:hypothetical protein